MAMVEGTKNKEIEVYVDGSGWVVTDGDYVAISRRGEEGNGVRVRI